MSCRLANVRIQVSRPAATTMTDRQTLKMGSTSTVGELSGCLEETSEEEREALIGLDSTPAMRFISERSWLLRTRDRLKVLDVKERWRARFGHLSGLEFVVLSTANSFRGIVAFLGAAQSEAK